MTSPSLHLVLGGMQMLKSSTDPLGRFPRATSKWFNSRLADGRRRALAVAAVSALASMGFGGGAAHGASAVWTTNGAGTWSNTANWGGNPAPSAADDTADFNTLDLAADTTVTLDVATTLGHLIFGDTETVTTPAGWLLDGTAGLTLSTTSGVPNVTVNALGTGRVARINVAVGGTQGLAKDGVGTLVLTGTNGYSGGTVIN